VGQEFAKRRNVAALVCAVVALALAVLLWPLVRAGRGREAEEPAQAARPADAPLARAEVAADAAAVAPVEPGDESRVVALAEDAVPPNCRRAGTSTSRIRPSRRTQRVASA